MHAGAYLPLAGLVLAVSAAALAAGPLELPAATSAIALAVALIPAALYLQQRRRIGRLRDILLRQPGAGTGESNGTDLVAAATGLRDRLAAAQTQLSEELARREQAQSALRESEERYCLAVRGANDGLWEWNIKTGAIFLSPRWRSMLALPDADQAFSIDGWKARIHPDDLLQVEAALRNHVDGFSPRFQSEHRVIRMDGAQRWILSRGSAIRHASGTAHRVIGLDTDITQFKRMEEIMMRVAEGTSASTGEAFFRSLVKNFAAVLGVQIAFVTECLDFPTTRVRALAYFERGSFRDGIAYDLVGTPCERVIREKVGCLYPTDLAALFPKDARLGMDSYYGLPIEDGDGRVLGHLAFLDDKQMDEGVVLESVYKIFTARAAAELTRQQTLRQVSELVGGLSAATGEASLRTLVRSFAGAMNVREAFVAECDDRPDARVQVLAWWRDGRFERECSYPLAGSVCEEPVRSGKVCFYPQGVGSRYPADLALRREAYLGVPCTNVDGRIIGHIACAHDRPLNRDLPDEAILKLFAERTALELQRRRKVDGRCAEEAET